MTEEAERGADAADRADRADRERTERTERIALGNAKKPQRSDGNASTRPGMSKAEVSE